MQAKSRLGLNIVRNRGEIRVYSEIFDEKVKFIIEDNGCGMSESVLNELRESISNADLNDVEVEGLSHVALANIERRIHSYFGNEFGTEIESEKDKGTRITVVLPHCKRFA